MGWVKATGDFQKFPRWEYLKDKVIEGVITRKALDVTAKKLCFYDIETPKGTLSVLGNVVINRILRELPEGTLVHMEYKGVSKSKTGTEFNDFDIMYDKEPSVETLAASVSKK